MRLALPIGISDFRDVRELRLEYVDKTDLVRALIDERGVQVFLFPRPRRFGKTLNMSMLRCFFEKREEDASALFEGLRIHEAGEAYRAHFQRYPVIYLTFKDIKPDTFERLWPAVVHLIGALFQEHAELLDAGVLTDQEARDFRAVLDRSAGRDVFERALADLSAFLHRRHGEKVVLLIDEYDAPLHAAYLNGYAREAVSFFRAFLTGGLKDNTHVFKAVLTGILRIAKESIFSGLNNVGVYSLLRTRFNTCFGFTEPEVRSLLTRTGREERLSAVRSWYNGYLFGGEVIYNPWSVVNYLDDEQEPRPYWLATSSNDLIRVELERRALELRPMFETLLQGGSVERVLDENVALGDIAVDDDAFVSLLVFAGYLKADKRSRGPDEQPAHALSIPNREVRQLYTGTFRRWMNARMERGSANLDALTRALLSGDAPALEAQLQAFVGNLLSYHDVGASEPERVYHGFVVGLLAVLEPSYQVRSNREAGLGRADVTIRPAQAGAPGAVLELKVVKPTARTPMAALRAAAAQIRDKDYAAELRAAGAGAVFAFAVAFDGKRVWVRSANDRAAITGPARRETKTGKSVKPAIAPARKATRRR